MDRRTFLQAAAPLLALGPLAPGVAAAQARPAPPPFPPVDSKSVWLVGDSAPTLIAEVGARLQALTVGRQAARDGYLSGGAVGELEAAFAKVLGKDDCAFFPTGTLANTVAVRVLCGEHRHALVPHESHLYRDESDATQRLAGINLVPLGHGRAEPTMEELTGAFDEAENGPYPLKVGALVLESPVRRRDGALVPVETVAAIAALARRHGTRLHLDAARLMLAPVVDLAAYSAPFDTVYVSLYKYLGAPFGAVLAGSKADIAQARDWRHVYGGLIHEGWEPALLALDGLRTFPMEIAKAHGMAAEIFAALEKRGVAKLRPFPNASNIRYLEMPEAVAKAAFERGRVAGVRIGRWEAGAIPFYTNATLNRRPVEDYVRLFAG